MAPSTIISSEDKTAAIILTALSSDPTGFYAKANTKVTDKDSKTFQTDGNLTTNSPKSKLSLNFSTYKGKASSKRQPIPSFQLPPRNLYGISTPSSSSKTVASLALQPPSKPPFYQNPDTRSRMASSSQLHSTTAKIDSNRDEDDGKTLSQGGETEKDIDMDAKDESDPDNEKKFDSRHQVNFKHAVIEDDEDYFVPGPPRLSQARSRVDRKGKGKPIVASDGEGNSFSHEDLKEFTTSRYQTRLNSRQHSGRQVYIDEEDNSLFSSPGREMRPSRYSGIPMPWGLNQDPPLVPQNEVSDASLMKRNLSRGTADKVCKRGYGANDPENIKIVNLRETRRMSFPEITEWLNQKRIDTGRTPSLSVCGVTSRYNRTAPLLYAAQGLRFVPLSERRSIRNGSAGHGTPTGAAAWTEDLDQALVGSVKDVDARRWQQVADCFFEKTGVRFSANAVSRRHALL